MRVPSLLRGISILAMGAPLFVYSQQRPVTICLVVVQASEDDRNNLIQYASRDARELAQALSAQTLPNGTPLVPILVLGIRSKDLNRSVEQRGCGYVADIQRHESVDIDPSGLGLATDVPSMGDRDMILLSLRRANSHKIIARMAEPPLTLRGRSHSVEIDPFHSFVREIQKKISRAEGAN